ncbi:M24 family metallopeptidase [Tropicimonas isoalkanivorans]|uniref:Xaa-Pro aminopeptidase n=1 Tax=Tropicimonas isoalkanivorans TaxID=441112 RepID=A0A1I1NFQ1_9RHOB|nr:Xaa-Pro peptidase family protein [Tropicimonas isoalkanivorans]SFC93613.1 Xaa-Pro aminopeptidase [Tropicimonas isoalkanivorans]
MDRYSDYRRTARAIAAEAVALVPGPNFERVYGVSFHSNERPLVIVIPIEGPPAAIVPNLELKSFEAIGFEGTVFDWRDQDGYADAFAAMAREIPLRVLAVEGQEMRVFVHHALQAAYPGMRILDAERDISALRRVKTEAEVATLEHAIAVSERALADVLDRVRVGQTEAEVEAMLTAALFRHGAQGHSFDPIVAAGDNSAKPHAHARSDYAIRAGDALLFDFGARVGGLNADITRTVFVDHAPEGAQAVYAAVLAANMRGHEVTRPGLTAHDVDDACSKVLEGSPFADRIRHKTGHGLGRAVHEAPQIMRGNFEILEPGMVFTIEPGLYAPGAFGIRIEDDVLVTQTGCRSLTTFPKDLTVVGQC